MAQDWSMCEVLGYNKADSPTKSTFIRWFGDPLLTGVLRPLFVATTLSTKRFDSMVVGDSHDIPTRMVDNSRDRKFGPKPAAYRNPNRELVRQHFTVGKVSGIIYAADTTLRTGPGSNDAVHLPSLLEQTKENAETVSTAAFDKAYGSHVNFAEAERLGVRFFVREKQGENRADSSWPPMARELVELERTKPADYAEVYRFRSKAEGTPSRIKARNPYVRLRRRKGDQVPQFPADAGGYGFEPRSRRQERDPRCGDDVRRRCAFERIARDSHRGESSDVEHDGASVRPAHRVRQGQPGLAQSTAGGQRTGRDRRCVREEKSRRFFSSALSLAVIRVSLFVLTSGDDVGLHRRAATENTNPEELARRAERLGKNALSVRFRRGD